MPIEFINNPTNAKQRFYKFMNDHEYVLCLYYMNGCGHCVSFAPLWHKVTKQYEQDINVLNIEYNCTHELNKEHKIDGFPTVILYQKGKKPIEYNKPRDQKNLSTFIQEHIIQQNEPKKKGRRNVKKT